MSVLPGESMEFYTSTGARTYSVSYVAFRNANPDSIDFNAIQNNRELVEELVCGPFLMTGHLQNTAHTPDQGCFDWDVSFSLTIPNSWQSGMYAAKLLDASGSVNYVPFVVNPDPAHRGNI